MGMEKVKAYLEKIDRVIAEGKYKDTWESLSHRKVPDWYRNARFGIFIHWGIYCVPAFGNEWYARDMYLPGSRSFEHHIETYGSQKDYPYTKFLENFKAEKFDADAWAELFEQAGAKFVMPVAEHHDGFQMYDSDLSEWCASKKGPMRDIVGELKAAVEKRDMTFCASSHRVEHYWFMSGLRRFDSGIGDPQYGDLFWPSVSLPEAEKNHALLNGFEVMPEFMEDWLARTCEIVDKYRPKILYFDWWIQIEAMKPYLRKLAAYYFNRAEEWGEEVTINYKNDAFMFGTGVRDIERGQLANISADYWQNDTAVAKNSWGYTVGNDYKKANEIVCDLVDIASKNGSLLLNIGPKADGTIPDEDRAILLGIGKWLRVNGEGIYGASYWKRFGEGPTAVEEGYFTDTLRKSFTSEDFRFTFKNGCLYVFAMKYPQDGVLHIRSLGKYSGKCNAVIRDAVILGQQKKPECILCDEYLTVIGERMDTEYPVCIRLTLD